MAEPYDSYNYPQFWHGRKYEDQAEKIAIKKFLSRISKKDNLIDIGGGFGRLTEVYASEFGRCVLVDPSDKLLGIARKNLKKFKNIDFKKGRGEDLLAEDNTFDVALMIRLVHHLPEPEKAFREALRVLKPQGYLICEFANKIHFQACLRAWLRLDSSFTRSLKPVGLSTKPGSIPFLNHHPQAIEKALEKSGFKIIEILSVSNFRHFIFKKFLPLHFLLFLESICHKPLATCYFGPSIFILAQKK